MLISPVDVPEAAEIEREFQIADYWPLVRSLGVGNEVQRALLLEIAQAWRRSWKRK